MREKSGTNSSPPLRSLRDLYRCRTASDAPFTTHALPSERLTAANKAMQSERALSGLMSTRGKVSFIRMRWKLPLRFRRSLTESGYLSRYMLDQVTVFISIGPWSHWWETLSGDDMEQDLGAAFKMRGFKLMGLGLLISRRYSELPEPTTEKVNPS